MDLISQFPRGPRERLAGVAMLPRTIDKARASLAGSLGEYIFDCPMDKQLFGALGVSAEDFLDAVRRSPDDGGVIAWLKERSAIPAGSALQAHNDAIEHWTPRSDAGRAHFAALREKLAPGRTDLLSWTDLLDIEEGRIALSAR